MSWPTCRRHPRTLAEAFPSHYADPIERFERNPYTLGNCLRAIVCVACCAAIGAMLAQGV